MKTISIALLLFCLTGALVSAQPSLAVHGSYGFSSQNASNGLWGAGAQLRIFLGPRVAVGAAARTYGETIRYESGSIDIDTRSTVTPVTGLLEFYLTDSGFRPYLGTEAGLYFLNIKLDDVKSSASRFGIAPKIGFQLPFSNAFGLIVEGAYNVVFGNKNGIQVGSGSNVDLNSSDRFFSLNAGLAIGLGSRRSSR